MDNREEEISDDRDAEEENFDGRISKDEASAREMNSDQDEVLTIYLSLFSRVVSGLRACKSI